MLGDEIAVLAHMPAAYPWSDLEGPCATSRMWPAGTTATDTVRPHRTHVLVTLVGGKSDRIRRRLLMTALAAVGARQAGALGIYWNGSMGQRADAMRPTVDASAPFPH